MSFPFRLVKNPYHLFHNVMSEKFHKSQKQNAIAIRDHLPAGAVKIDESKIVELLKYDYIDLQSEKATLAHIQAINEVLKAQLGRTVDILTNGGRKLVEGKDYQYPGVQDLESNSAFNVFRGVWQLFHPSLQHEHVNGPSASSDRYVRSAVLIFYGFIPDRARKEKRKIDLLIIGRSTLWRATAWAGPEKLYVHATECLREDVFEDQFFVFQLPGFHDYFRRGGLTEMHGILAGTVLDSAYEGKYPVVASPCVARKLSAWSSWFAEHDRFIDANFVSTLRKSIDLEYRTLGELINLSRAQMPVDKMAPQDERQNEYFSKLEGVLGKICDLNGSLVHPLIRI